jgi:hypothetical protein
MVAYLIFAVFSLFFLTGGYVFIRVLVRFAC